jgi:hypothetical protein
VPGGAANVLAGDNESDDAFVERGDRPVQYHTLKPERLIETQNKLTQRIVKRFPDAGLGQVSSELLKMVQEAAVRAERIRRPNWPLRVAVLLLALGALGLGLRLATSLQVKSDLRDAMGLFQFVEAVMRACFFFGAAVLFLVSLEVRLKRRRALKALHELRAMAHVVDMHQVAKDPEGLMRGQQPGPDAPKQTTRTPEDLNRYLNYCSELLSIISKVAALYVQDFPDGPAVAAADQVESLCSGLSQRIWQKIMVLDQLVGQGPPVATSGNVALDGSPSPARTSPSSGVG